MVDDHDQGDLEAGVGLPQEPGDLLGLPPGQGAAPGRDTYHPPAPSLPVRHAPFGGLSRAPPAP